MLNVKKKACCVVNIVVELVHLIGLFYREVILQVIRNMLIRKHLNVFGLFVSLIQKIQFIQFT